MAEVARSDNVQDGDDDPLERVVYYFPSPGIYHLAISRQPGAVDRTLELFSEEHDLHFQTAASSLWVPADSPGSLTVGATYWQNNTLEGFSSRGPTRDGRVKPDLVAPDGVSVSTETWRSSGFYGTSASAPHVASAAALVLEAWPTYVSMQTQSWLEDRAVDLGSAGKDNAYGAGRLNLPVEISVVTPGAALQGSKVTLTVSGVPFTSTATFALAKSGYDEIVPSGVTWISASKLTGSVDLGEAALGLWTVVVTNTPSSSLSLPDAFLVASDQAYLPLVMRNAWP
jgi:subtilisin family serine protease